MKITNPKVRNAAYIAYSALSLALGSIVVFCGASDAYTLPEWVTPATAAIAYIGAGLGLVASANTSTKASTETADTLAQLRATAAQLEEQAGVQGIAQLTAAALAERAVGLEETPALDTIAAQTDETEAPARAETDDEAEPEPGTVPAREA